MSTQIVQRTNFVMTGAEKMTTISMGRETIRNNGFAAQPGVMGQVKSYIARSKAEKQHAKACVSHCASDVLRRLFLAVGDG